MAYQAFTYKINNMEKTLVIERPEGLSAFKKNLTLSKKELEESSKLVMTPGFLESLSDSDNVSAGSLFCLGVSLQYIKEGCVVTVSKEVSRAMETSRMVDALFENIPFIASSMEFVWEDADLPNCIFSKTIRPDVGEAAVTLFDSKYNYNDKRKGSTVVVCTPLRELALFVREDYEVKKAGVDEGFIQRPEYDGAVKYMTSLCLRVLAYAAVPQVKQAIEYPKTRAERKQAGVWRDQQELPPGGIIHLRNLPRVVREVGDVEPSAGDAGSRRSFLGRLGHIRYFKSERFSEAVRGTWKWIAPVMPPEGVKLVYQVSAKPDLHKTIN